jgi:hypothetical protein
MPQDVIDRVHKLARQSFASKDIVFQFRDGGAVDEDDESAADPDYDPDDDDSGNYDMVDGEADDDISVNEGSGNDSDDGNASESDDSGQDDPKQADDESTGVMESANNDDVDIGAGDDDDDDANIGPEEDETTGVLADIVETGEAADASGLSDTEVENTETTGVPLTDQLEALDQRYGQRQHGYDLRPRKPRSYKHRHADLEDVLMTQLSLKKGLVAYGEEGANAVTKELTQLHDMRVMSPRAANLLTKEEKHRALQYLMYLKKKRCGRVKGRGCADGQKQRVYKSKEESSSPTVAIESLFLTAVIDAKERQDVGIL